MNLNLDTFHAPVKREEPLAVVGALLIILRRLEERGLAMTKEQIQTHDRDIMRLAQGAPYKQLFEPVLASIRDPDGTIVNTYRLAVEYGRAVMVRERLGRAR